MKFSVVRKGYDVDEVDSYLDNKDRACRDNLHEKVMRIEELKADIARRDVELMDLRAKSDSINIALMSAVDKAKEMDMQARLRYSLEIERIKLFRAKWQAYASRNVNIEYNEHAVKLEALEGELLAMAASKLNIVVKASEKAKNVAEESYLAESTRLINKVKNQQKKKEQEPLATSNEFNLDDLNKPHDLQDLVAGL